MTPTTVAEEFLESRLAVVVERVWQDEAPAGEAYPFCLFEYQDGQDRAVVNGMIIGSELVYAVGVWVQDQDYTAAETLFDAAHNAVHGQRWITTPSGVVMFCVRERETSIIKRSYREGSSVYRYVGAMYRMKVV